MKGLRLALLVGLLMSAFLIGFFVNRGREPAAPIIGTENAPLGARLTGSVGGTSANSNSAVAITEKRRGVLDAVPALQSMSPRLRLEHLRGLQRAIVKQSLTPFEERSISAAALLADLNARAASGDLGATVAANSLIERCGELISAQKYPEILTPVAAANAEDCRQIADDAVRAATMQLIETSKQGDALANLQILDRGGTSTHVLGPLIPLTLHDPAFAMAQQEAIKAAITFMEPMGSPGIFLKASNAYGDLSLLPPDKALWLAYSAAGFVMASTSSINAEVLQTRREILADDTAKLTQAERERALQTANAILARCCAGVKFDLGMLKK